MPGQEGFVNPFAGPQRNGTSSNRNPAAIGSGRSRNHRNDDHSPTSHTNGNASPGSHLLRLRKLPPNSTQETVRSILLFAKDLIRVEIVPSPDADVPYCTAVAHFTTREAANEVGKALHGKRPGQDSQELLVEWLEASPSASPTQSHLQNGADDHPPKHSSRFSDTFRDMGRGDMDRVSPTEYSDMSRSYMEGSVADGISPTFRSALPGNGVTFGTQSPARSSRERQHVSGRSMIQEDGADDEPNQIMQDPGSFMSAERQRPYHEQGRRATAPNIHMLHRMGSLSINSNVGSSVAPNVMSPRTNGYGYQPSRNGAFSPQQNGYGMGMPPGQYSSTTSPVTAQYQPIRRMVMPPVNPSDQNPPCNTLYVGNLAPDTSEDELKHLFSRQRGYRRLCFRMKHQGPMCFVEFEDVALATRALRDLYGHQLSNSNNKGGIRLSFSKNPLGVRGNNQQSPISPNGIQMPGGGPGTYGGWPAGFGDMANQPFSTANGPPPGLPPPQQRNNSTSHANGNGNGNVNGNGSGNGNGNGHMPDGSFGGSNGGYPFGPNGRGFHG